LLALLGRHAGPGVSISEATHLVADLGFDSLGVMEIVAGLEDEFHLQIPADALREVETVGDVATAIERRLKVEGRLGE
jgi:acyl carrier protein